MDHSTLASMMAINQLQRDNTDLRSQLRRLHEDNEKLRKRIHRQRDTISRLVSRNQKSEELKEIFSDGPKIVKTYKTDNRPEKQRNT